MLCRGQRPLVTIVAPLVVLVFILFRFRDHKKLIANHQNSELTFQPSGQALDVGRVQDQSEPSSYEYVSSGEAYRTVFSASTADQKYFLLDFGQYASNPNIIAHPTLEDTWMIVAQQEMKEVRNYLWWAEIACNASFEEGVLSCIEDPVILPISPTSGLNCNGKLKYFGDSVGPHDARVFYGPKAPYVIYGSNSVYTCFGQWMLDLRPLVSLVFERDIGREVKEPTELQRPFPWSLVEKNWFVFWDKDGQIYTHYDVWPKRVFAQLEYNGRAGENLASRAAAKDDKCMAKYMPKVSKAIDPIELTPLETIHQATNSLSITLCKRSDPSCVADDSNTFIFMIFQHKTYLWSHSVYEPYAMLFRQTAPFEVHAISTKPIWIHGRGGPGAGKKPATLTPANIAVWAQTEMFYVTSLSWKGQGQRYHGYIDDVLFVAFGIEDEKSAAIDLVAGDLLQDLGFCYTY
jgi:hypothetical protein